ncbi:MAG: hypothetical protein HQM09_18625 [Candidatus Riflebacteria bacterium]|nr:hypothetical protein [Candidatus Riflebacteria bacterium]
MVNRSRMFLILVASLFVASLSFADANADGQKSQAEQMIQSAYKTCTESGWSLPAQRQYYEAAKNAVNVYQRLDPNNARLKDLNKLQSDIGGDIRRISDENVDKAYKACTQDNWSLKSQIAYFFAARAACDVYTQTGITQGNIFKLKSDIQRDVRRIADEKVDAAYKNCTQNKWDLKSQQAYLAAAQEALDADMAVYEGSAGGITDPRILQLRQLVSDITRDVAKLLNSPNKPPADVGAEAKKQADQSLQAAYKACTQNGWSMQSQMGYLRAAKGCLETYQKFPNAPGGYGLKQLEDLTAGISRDVRRLGDDNVGKAYTNCTQNGWSLKSQEDYLQAAKEALAAYTEGVPVEDARVKSLTQLVNDITRDVNRIRGEQANTPPAATATAPIPPVASAAAPTPTPVVSSATTNTPPVVRPPTNPKPGAIRNIFKLLDYIKKLIEIIFKELINTVGDRQPNAPQAPSTTVPTPQQVPQGGQVTPTETPQPSQPGETSDSTFNDR